MAGTAWPGYHCGSSHFTVRGLLGCAGLLGSHTVPAGRGRMEPATFVAELRARLGIPDADQDAWCPPLRWDLGRAKLPRRDVRCRW